MKNFRNRFAVSLFALCLAFSLTFIPTLAFAQDSNLLSYEEAIESLGAISLTDVNELSLIDESLDALGARYFAPQYKYVADALLALSRDQYIDFDAIGASLELLQSNSNFMDDYNSNEGLSFIPLTSLIQYVQARKLENEGQYQQAYEAYKISQILDSLDRAMVIYPQLNTTATESTTDSSTAVESPLAMEDSLKYAVITDGGSIESSVYNQSVWQGVVAFATANALLDSSYSVYIPKSSKAADLANEIESAINDGAKVILLTGFSWDKSVLKIASKHPDVCFLSYGLTEKKYPINMVNVNFAEEISGFLAGYAVVKDGYTQLGFLGGYDIPPVKRFGYGFIQGANKAAVELNASISMNFWYCKSFSATDEITSRMNDWYANGTEVVFSCGGDVIQSCVAAAEQTGGKVIGVDQDQASLSDTIITSACKLYDMATEYLLQQHYTSLNRWPSYMAGTNVRLSLEEKSVGLPTDDSSWRFSSFTRDDYNQVVTDILQGKFKISDSTSTRPKVAKVKVNYLK